MKKTLIYFATLIALAVAGIAFAAPAGQLPVTKGKPQTFIQNLKGVSPVAGKSRCDTTATATKGNTTFTGYTSTGYLGVEAIVVNSATNAPVNVIWVEDNKEVWVGSSYCLINSEGATVSKVKWTYTNDSSASINLKSCARRQ